DEEDGHPTGFDVDGEADAVATCVEAEVRGYALNVAFAVLGEAYDGPVDDHGLVRVQRIERAERGVVPRDAELHRPRACAISYSSAGTSSLSTRRARPTSNSATICAKAACCSG